MFLVSNSIIVIPKVSGLSFLDLKIKPVFKRILAKAFCQYILNLMLKKKLGSFNDLITNTYFQSFIYVCPSMVCHDILGITVSLALLSKIQLILERLNKNITKP